MNNENVNFRKRNNLTNIFSYTHPHNGSEEVILRQLHNFWEIGLKCFDIDPIDDNLGLIVERQKMFGNSPMFTGTYTEKEPANKARPHLEDMSIVRVNLAGFDNGEFLKNMVLTLFHELQHHIQYRENRLTDYNAYWRNATKGKGDVEPKPAIKVYRATFDGLVYGYQEHDDCPWEVECDQVAKRTLDRLGIDWDEGPLNIRIPKQTVRRRGERRIIYNPFK